MKLSSILHRSPGWRLALTLGLSFLLLACIPVSQPVDEATSTDATVSADTTPVTTTDTVSPTTPLTATATITDSMTTPILSATEQQLVEQAMKLVAAEGGVVSELTLTSMEAVEWPDSSLGCPQPDTMYMQVITPGYRITLTDANGTVYDVHTGSAAAVPMLLCTAAAGAPSAETPQNPVDRSGVLTGTVS